MMSRNDRLMGFALVSLLAVAATACAGEVHETPDDSAEQASPAERSEASEAEQATLKVESSTVTPQDGIGEKGSSCPIWQCGFNGLAPTTLKLAHRFGPRAGSR